MTLTQEGVRNRGQQLRLWLGVVIVILQLLTRLGLPVVAPEKTIFGVLAGPIGGLAVLLWWLLLSRAYWAERLGAVGGDRRRDVRDVPCPRRVDREGGGALFVPHVGDPVAGHRLGRLGRGHPPALRWTSVGDDGRDHLRRLWWVGAGPNRWVHRRRLSTVNYFCD